MASELVVKALMREKAKLQSATFGLMVLGIPGFGLIYLASKGMSYMSLVHCASVGFHASIVFGFLMLLYGGKWHSYSPSGN